MTPSTAAAGGALRIASFGFRSLPPRAGAAGADKFALELLPRLAARGHSVVAYNRAYEDEDLRPEHRYRGVTVLTMKTWRKAGPEALWHSACVTWDIIRHNRADIVHMQNGGNSPFGLLLRLFGKKTFLTEDGVEWERAKWPWYGRLYLRLMTYLSAFVHNEVIFDNVFAREMFERKFGRRYRFIPYGADVAYDGQSNTVLDELGLQPGKYFLFVGRFIPDKGVHRLVDAFERLDTDRKLVLVGGSPGTSDYEKSLRATTDPRILFTGYLYGDAVHALMSKCFAYVQPSDLEGLSPVILESAFLKAPVICSDLPANKYALEEHGIYFKKGDADDLLRRLQKAVADPAELERAGALQARHVAEKFSWETAAEAHISLFAGSQSNPRVRAAR